MRCNVPEAFVAGTQILWAELVWCARHESVHHLDDLLLRRTRYGLILPQGVAKLTCQCCVACVRLHWAGMISAGSTNSSAIWQSGARHISCLLSACRTVEKPEVIRKNAVAPAISEAEIKNKDKERRNEGTYVGNVSARHR
jgi:hypothetical protein